MGGVIRSLRKKREAGFDSVSLEPLGYQVRWEGSRGALCNASGIPDGEGVRGGVSPCGEGKARGNPCIGKTPLVLL